MIGKSLDGSAPVGPWLVTADLADGDNLKIECRVNGEVRQSSNTSDMVFNCKQLVSYISNYFTLRPGDIIFTGTPEGVIAGYPKDKQVWLKAGRQGRHLDREARRLELHAEHDLFRKPVPTFRDRALRGRNRPCADDA